LFLFRSRRIVGGRVAHIDPPDYRQANILDQHLWPAIASLQRLLHGSDDFEASADQQLRLAAGDVRFHVHFRCQGRRICAAPKHRPRPRLLIAGTVWGDMPLLDLHQRRAVPGLVETPRNRRRQRYLALWKSAGAPWPARPSPCYAGPALLD
jgi:hypothetical protein